MIENIAHISSKSFSDYSSKDKFKQINIIFGTNGSGKTSLSNWLEQQALGKARVFSSKYVRNNILAQDEVSGVKLTVGQEAVDIETNIERIRNANENIRVQNEIIEKHTEHEKKRLFTVLDTTLGQAKNQFKLTRKINQKINAKSDPIRALKLWFEEIREDLVIPSSSEELEQEMKLLKQTSLKLIFSPNISQDRFENFVKALNEPTLVPSTSISNEVAEWITSGLKMHNMNHDDEICQFCGNKFNGPDIEKIITEKTSNKHASLIKALKKFKAELEDLKKETEKLTDEIDATKLLGNIDKLFADIDNKIEDTNRSIVVSQSFFDEMLDMQQKVSDKIRQNKLAITSVSEQLARIENVAKSWIGQQLKKNTQINNMVTNIQNDEKLVQTNDEIIEKNRSWIFRQQTSNSDLKPFRDLVNHQFKLIGLNFELEIMPDNQHYLIKHVQSQITISTTDLSEGERRLLGFLHFYFDLFDKPDETLMSDVDLIIIDDPITSLDSDNRYYLTELINEFIKNVAELDSQLFVFTHSSLDFHNFGFSANRQKTQWFKIYKNIQGNSEIRISSVTERKNYSDYYQSNFKDIFTFAAMSKSKLSDCNFISFGNKARLVFESHVRTHYKIEYATNTENAKLQEFYEVPDSKKSEFSKMLDVINSLSHGMTFADNTEISAREVQDNIKTMLQILYQKDRFHVEQMVGNLITKDNESNIYSWLKPFNET